jgi:hypothetical protein
MFRSNIKNGLEPSKHETIDETLYPFRGRCRFRQYMPNKPAKYGLKYFSIVDLETSYLLDTHIYLGKNNAEESVNISLAQDVVLKLASPFFGTNRCITMDNWFTSVDLARALFEKNLTMLGLFFILSLNSKSHTQKCLFICEFNYKVLLEAISEMFHKNLEKINRELNFLQ